MHCRLIFIALCLAAGCGNRSEKIDTANAIQKLGSINKDSLLKKQIYSEALESQMYKEAWMQVYTIKERMKLADSGIISKDEVIQSFNNSIGMTMGIAKSFSQVKTKMANDTAYLRFIALKIAANIALKKAADANSKSEQLKAN